MIKYFVWILLFLLPLPSWAGTLAIDVGTNGSKLSQTVNKTSTKPIKFMVWLYPKSATITQATLNIKGGKSQEENYGTGTNYILGGPGITKVTHVPPEAKTNGSYPSPYEFSTATVTIPPGAYSTYFTITPVDNKCISLDKTLKIYLSDPSVGNSIARNKSGENSFVRLKIYDDTIPRWNGVRNIVSVLTPNLDFDTKNFFDRGISKVAVGDGKTDDTAAIQEVSDWVYAHGGGLVYFPGPAIEAMNASVGFKQNLPQEQWDNAVNSAYGGEGSLVFTGPENTLWDLRLFQQE